MQSEAQLNPQTMERLEEQSGLLLRIYKAEFAKDPTSRATGSARSNLIALKQASVKSMGSPLRLTWRVRWVSPLLVATSKLRRIQSGTFLESLISAEYF